MYSFYKKNNVLIIRTDLNSLHRNDIIVSVNKADYTLKHFDKKQSTNCLKTKIQRLYQN